MYKENQTLLAVSSTIEVTEIKANYLCAKIKFWEILSRRW